MAYMVCELIQDHSDLQWQLAKEDPESGPMGAMPQIVSLSPELENQQEINEDKVSILVTLPQSSLSRKVQGDANNFHTSLPGNSHGLNSAPNNLPEVTGDLSRAKAQLQVLGSHIFKGVVKCNAFVCLVPKVLS